MATVLLVDDDDQTRSVLRRRLGTAGHQVVEAVSAESALASFEQTSPDVVLTDLRLPGLSGEQLIATLRREHGSVRFIAISGAPERLAALGAEGVHLLPKPFTSEQLNDALAGAMSPGPEEPAGRSWRQWWRRLWSSET